MTHRVMGMETEYAISGRYQNGDSLENSFLTTELILMAAGRLANLPAGGNGGLFLGNGSRFYIDTGNHPEISTPECLTPWEVVRYITAGDHILRDLANRLGKRLGEGFQIEIAKVNVDYSGSGNTWGCHESYSHRIQGRGFFNDLIPHLVSRIIYTGAGGFNSLAPGLEFTLSPRTHHLVDSISGSSTNGRGIVHTKNEDLTGGYYNRLHLLCGESLYSQTAAVLKVGTTALVVALLEHGLADLSTWHLDEPLAAMNAFTQDPTCRATAGLATDLQVSALEIQHHYLSLIESELGAEWMPEWALDICRLWRSTLADLDAAPESVGTSLDWAVKHFFFGKLIREHGFSAEKITRWNEFQDRLFQNLDDTGAVIGPHLLGGLLNPTNEDQIFSTQKNTLLSELGLEREELTRFLELRRDLFHLDTQFNTVGTDSVFQSLQDADVLNHEIPGVGKIAPAMTEAPAGTRARLRGKTIREFCEKEGENLCGWDFVDDQVKGLQLNLTDPLIQEEVWEPIRIRRRNRSRLLSRAGRSTDFLELLHSMDL